ncbi:MAG: protocatechuate 3,4-dioxygenase subunit beta [Candidatus Binataceae bacterium]
MNTPSGYRREAPGCHPAYDCREYASTHKRAPSRPPVRLEQTLSEITGPHPGAELIGPVAADMSRYGGGEAIGERIIVCGRVLDEDGRPLPDTLVELWQANAAGRYAHAVDQHDAPLDSHFSGVGRVLTNQAGVYRFLTIRPGAYPWRNHKNAWRPRHIHFSLFGPGFATRLVTQMYFPGDPLLALDPILNSVPDAAARERLISVFDMELSQSEYALGYRFDLVLRGSDATPMEVDT